MDPGKTFKQKENPRLQAHWLSVMFFSWLHPFLQTGYTRGVGVDDLYTIIPEDRSEKLGQRLLGSWNKELAKAKDQASKKPSLARALARVFGPQFMLVGLLAFTEECVLRIMQPVCLAQLLFYFEPDSTMPDWQAWLYATGVVLGSAVYVFTHHPYFFGVQHVGMKMRVAACSLIYQKSMRLSQKALGQTTVGQMVNLMSNDVNRFDLSVIFVHYLWVGPLQTLISTAILLSQIGPSSLVGLVILILFVPLQSWLGRVFSRLRMRTARRTDERIRTMNEIIGGMRVIKLYAWEKPFAKLVETCRAKEVNVIRRTGYYRGLNMSLFYTSGKVIIFLTLLVYVLGGNALTADKVFLVVSLFNNIRLIMTLFFPGAITQLAEALVSIRRIENFLMLDERPEAMATTPAAAPAPASCGVVLENVTVKWPASADEEENTLTDVSLRVGPGQTLAVVGHVGAGKSSLLNVLLGELAPLSGSLQLTGRRAYAPQEPWIFSATIRQNILCGRPYDARRYNKVLKACALDKDLSQLPLGDRTALGERGVSLSGGQKARVSLARCLYVEADVYLLDDPLSAVDTHVGRHLFDQAIGRLLDGKIRILATHQLQFLREVDQIVVLKQGRVEAVGTYDELVAKGVDLSRTTADEDADDDADDEEARGRADTTRSDAESLVPSASLNGSLATSLRRRLGSTASWTSHASVASVLDDAPAFAEEARTSGNVTAGVYWRYFHSGGGYLSFSVLVATCLLTQVLFSGADQWLTIWTNAEERRAQQNQTTTPAWNASMGDSLTDGYGDEGGWLDDVSTKTGVVVYSILVGSLFVISLLRSIHYFLLCTHSSVVLHNRMFQAIIRVPVAFFDANPVGRILNRFTKDIGCMDELLPAAFFDVITIFLTQLGILILVGIVNPFLVVPVFFLAVIFYFLRRYYMASAREVKRLEATTRSPVFTHLSSSLIGLTTLRAHHCERVFQGIFDSTQDIHSSAWYMFLATTRWFGIWLDWICVFYIICVVYCCVLLRGSLTASDAGLAISSAMTLTGAFQWAVRQSAEVENQMTSVERVIEYSKLPAEAPLQSQPDKKPPENWPTQGALRFEHMFLRYKETDQPVLNNVTCVIQAKEKIGIVGRTGAGKSSLITSLFRLTEPEGHVFIDGIDTKSLGLHDLRSKISIIPQDPVLFTGSLRRNLDPFGEYDDDLLWKALESVKLKEAVSDLSAGLDSQVAEGGSNFSVGQRQLVCLARAILRRNRILVLDEATANVDPKTDRVIQTTIREQFADCTVLTIAHRLNTIMDADRVLVLDAGHVRELDEPAVLLENPNTLFHGLVHQTGPPTAQLLTDMARQAAQQRRASRGVRYGQSNGHVDAGKT